MTLIAKDKSFEASIRNLSQQENSSPALTFYFLHGAFLRNYGVIPPVNYSDFGIRTG